MKAMYEILAPTISNEGRPYRTRCHKDRKDRKAMFIVISVENGIICQCVSYNHEKNAVAFATEECHRLLDTYHINECGPIEDERNNAEKGIRDYHWYSPDDTSLLPFTVEIRSVKPRDADTEALK